MVKKNSRYRTLRNDSPLFDKTVVPSVFVFHPDGVTAAVRQQRPVVTETRQKHPTGQRYPEPKRDLAGAESDFPVVHSTR